MSPPRWKGNLSMPEYDLVIRNGLIVDGSGAEPIKGDLAVKDGVISAIGKVEGKGSEEIDSTGLLVTPGFIDPHTHYDGQVIWSDRLNPSSNHGFTTVLIGNCGVGFAPCRPDDQERLVRMMEGVEDIPGAVMAKGLDWTWETFPQYMDAVAERPHDIDIAVLLPHSPLRVYVMGDRGVRREAATSEDLREMRRLTREAMEAGAVGFSTSRVAIHRTIDGDLIPSYDAAVTELEEMARGMADAGGGMIQAVPDLPESSYFDVAKPLVDVAIRTGQRLTMTIGVMNSGEKIWPEVIDLIDGANKRGVRVTGQIFPRPVGMIIGLDLSVHPFALKPSYKALAELSLAERVATMRDPHVRARLIAEDMETDQPLRAMSTAYDWTFQLDDDPNYEPKREDSIAARAQVMGMKPEELMYDLLLENGGTNRFLVALANLPDYSLDQVGQLLEQENVILGLGDGGAHYGMICDSSYSSFMLQHWGRQRDHGRIPVQKIINKLSAEPAEVLGLKDRGLLAVGCKADINVIDFGNVRLHAPQVTHDLPAGGKRLDQNVEGFAYTFVSGRCVVRNGKPTGEKPGRLIRSTEMRNLT